ncbi:MAG TPA: F0F1 ATP synthase subunit B [Kiritimatiellia bacterium]
MAEEHATPAAHAEVPSHGTDHAAPELINLSGTMMILTWVVFAITAFILYKKAWKPILQGLDKREADLRQAIDDAAKTRDELAKIDDQRKHIIAEADAKARDVLDSARKAAVEAAQAIEAKAREESQILLENAQREIRAERERAVASLRRESADLAVSLARKIIGSNLDETRSRAVTDQLIKEL